MLPVRALPVIIYLAVTVPLAFLLNVWQDDAYTLHTTHDGIAYAFSQAVTFETNAPLYFVLETLWRHLNESAVWARFFSVFCGAGVVAVMPALARRYVPQLPPLPIALASALNPLLIWAGLEIRLYAMVILLSALLLLLFYDAFIVENRGFGSRMLYGAVAITAAYTQYYLLFLVAAQGAVLLLTRRRTFRAYVLTGFAVVLGFAPMASLVISQMREFGSGVTPPTLLDCVRWLAEILTVYVLPLNALPGSHLLYAAAAIAVIGSVLVWRRSFAARGQTLVLEILAAAYVIFVLGLFAAGEPIFTRHAASLFVPAILSAFAICTFLRPSVRGRAFAAYTIAAICVEAAALFATYRQVAKPGDWIRVASFITAHETSNEPIAVFEAENALPLSYYYRGKNRIVAVPRPIDFRSFDQRAFVVHTQADVERPIRRAGGAGMVWFVTSGSCNASNIQFGCGVVERSIARDYRVVSSQRFYKATVRLLRPANIGTYGRPYAERTGKQRVNLLQRRQAKS